MSSAQFRRTLEDGDYMGMWMAMARDFPTAPAPKTPVQAEIVMHRIRTETNSLSDEKRCYSHHWLTERDYPSNLPDHLRAKADRLYPRVVQGVGISVNFSKTLKGLFPGLDKRVEGAMADAVEVLAADGVDLNSPVVKPYMFEARERALKQLVGVTNAREALH